MRQLATTLLGFALATASALADEPSPQVKAENQPVMASSEVNPYETKSTTAVGIRLDCLHSFNRSPGAAQGCLTLTGLRFSLREQFHPQLQASLALDPFASLGRKYDKSPFIADKPLLRDTALGPLASYELVWSPRKNLNLSLELYEGATYFPDTSGLPLRASFADFGWKQSALAITYHLPLLEGVKVKFVGGNGEGELIENVNPQQYFGFELHADFIKGLELHAGLANNGNHLGSVGQQWVQKSYEQECGLSNPQTGSLGYAVRRLSAALVTNKQLPFTPGLRLGLGWHKSIASDLDKDKDSGPSLAELEKCPRLNPDYLFIEDPQHGLANSMQHTVVGLNASYHMLDTYFLGFDYEKRTIASEIAYFQVCGRSEQGKCMDPSSPGKSLEQWAYSIGGGMTLSEGLILSFAYHMTAFAHLYKKIYYDGRNGNISRSLEAFDARLSYHWD